jgi:hypothetical protein
MLAPKRAFQTKVRSGEGWVVSNADEFAAEVDQNRRPLDQARPILLAVAGGKPSDAAAVRGDGTKDCRLTGPVATHIFNLAMLVV